MTIALNLLYLVPGEVGGTETYARGLLAGLAAEAGGRSFRCYVNSRASDWPLPTDAAFTRVVCPVAGSRRWARYAFEQFRLPGLLQADGADVVHSLGYVAPLAAPCPSVVTIHDMNYRSSAHVMSKSRRLVLSAFVGLSARRAAAIIADSDFSRREICSVLGVSPRRVHVVHLAPRVWQAPAPTPTEITATAERLGLHRPYALAFSSTSANKNIPRLLRAFEAARSAGAKHSLAIVGHLPADLLAEIAALTGRPGWLQTMGYLDEASLRAVLRGADFLAFPSLYEGFGLPVLEAMSEGVPVTCARAASLPEVAGEAAVYFDPTSEEEMAHALIRVAGDVALRERLVVEGRANAARFTWERAARETLAIYSSLSPTPIATA